MSRRSRKTSRCSVAQAGARAASAADPSASGSSSWGWRERTTCRTNKEHIRANVKQKVSMGHNNLPREAAGGGPPAEQRRAGGGGGTPSQPVLIRGRHRPLDRMPSLLSKPGLALAFTTPLAMSRRLSTSSAQTAWCCSALTGFHTTNGEVLLEQAADLGIRPPVLTQRERATLASLCAAGGSNPSPVEPPATSDIHKPKPG